MHEFLLSGLAVTYNIYLQSNIWSWRHTNVEVSECFFPDAAAINKVAQLYKVISLQYYGRFCQTCLDSVLSEFEFV